MITLPRAEILLKKLFLPNKWLKFYKFKKKYSKIQKEKTQTIENTTKKHIRHNPKKSQNALSQSKAFEQAIKTWEKFLKT